MNRFEITLEGGKTREGLPIQEIWLLEPNNRLGRRGRAEFAMRKPWWSNRQRLYVRASMVRWPHGVSKWRRARSIEHGLEFALKHIRTMRTVGHFFEGVSTWRKELDHDEQVLQRLIDETIKELP